MAMEVATGSSVLAGPFPVIDDEVLEVQEEVDEYRIPVTAVLSLVLSNGPLHPRLHNIHLRGKSVSQIAFVLNLNVRTRTRRYIFQVLIDRLYV